jgi:hypothetical protein
VASATVKNAHGSPLGSVPVATAVSVDAVSVVAVPDADAVVAVAASGVALAGSFF